ncbi:glycosyl transferase, group 1 family protein [Rhodopirellula baltica SH28]|uniref:Glycosyl transferase, group 1 family protein n=1 Tax=Rhodopirellula baltica SH28 TaxID=993517 RepID=K5D7H3_RHOBT|nr:glycosyltransferase family 4 protein [Rhodopirellula baltica]EKJ98728.1 glycosyl transferase, group 1 family protein [Rhodopirellula baltica SH28]
MKIVYIANTDWYLYNFRRNLMVAAQESGHDVLALSPPGPYGARLNDLGISWQPLEMNRSGTNPLEELKCVWTLSRILREKQADLVHSFTIKGTLHGSLACIAARTRARVNAVAGLGFIFTSGSLKARLLRFPVGLLLKVAMGGANTRVILQNPDDVRAIQQASLAPENNIRLILGSGVDCIRFSPRRSPAEPESISVLLAARLLRPKGIEDFVEASRLLRKQGASIRFLLAGTPDPGNPDSIEESSVREWVKEGLVEWLGHVEDMPSLMSEVDVFVLPTYYGEGLPRSLIEAAASGLALITTDIPGCREVVSHEEDGLRVPVRDPQSLASAIRRLDNDRELTVRLGNAAREKATQLFDERIVVEKTLAVYKELDVAETELDAVTLR